MTRIEKYTLDRMKGRALSLSFECPHCRGARLEIRPKESADPWEGVRCFKCKALVVLDGLSLTVIREAAPRAAEG
ncbi:MAG: hypothetical protein HY557_01105 [Euryarchaeota archaeon]|nr:hypothetical protein [Euryarchaeota archaeon]